MLSLFRNYVLLSGLISWLIAQTIKVPLEYLRRHKWNWSLLFRAGGMPSSHSALITAITHSIGLFEGFNTSLFALAAAIAIVVIYDATGIRRQAGKHAVMINAMINDLTSGNPLKSGQLMEVLGHTPLEALAGILLGILVAQIVWFIAR
jgi:acid phosphatase family membrane protein YuiD